MDMFLRQKQESIYESVQTLYDYGQIMEISKSLEEDKKEHIDIITLKNSLNPILQKTNLLFKPKKLKYKEKKYVIVESPHQDKKMILEDKLNISNLDSQNMNSLQTLEVELTLRGRDLKPFWNMQSKEISKSLWLPTKIDCVDSDLTLSNGLFQNSQMVKSWFLNKLILPQNKNLSMMSFQSLMFSQLKSMEVENIKKDELKLVNPKKRKRQIEEEIKEDKINDDYITKTIRLYPNKNQVELLKKWFGVFRWFYNRAIDYAEQNKTYGFYNVRNGMRNIQNRKFDNPEWCNEDKIPPRIITGAIMDSCKAFKSAFSNLKAKNIKKFKMKYKTKKDTSQSLYLESSCFGNKGILPTFGFCKIKGLYKNGNCVIEGEIKSDCRLVFHHNKYFLHVPIPNLKPVIIQSENQAKNRIIGIDSGIRTFQTGYSPSGHAIELGINMNNVIKKYIDKISDLTSRKERIHSKSKKLKLSNHIKQLYWSLKNKINELHWKTINFLTLNYSIIMISDFKLL